MLPWKLVVITGASGSGKTTFFRTLEKVSGERLFGIPSITTRSPRAGDESSFRYVSHEEFATMESRGEFLWVTEVHQNFYGTRKRDMGSALRSNTCAVMMVTPDYCARIANIAREAGIPASEVFFAHICSPGEEILKERLKKRGDSPVAIWKRVEECKTWDAHARTLNLPIVLFYNSGTPDDLEKQLKFFL